MAENDSQEQWILNFLKEQNLVLTGDIERPHIRSWGEVWRVPTNGGDFYFKTVTKSLGNEPAVTQALSGWFPEMLPKLLKVDLEQNWMLVVDGGPRLRDAFKGGLEIGAWSDVLASYAQFQMDVSSHVDELLALGLPDRRLDLLPGLYEGIIEDTEWLLIGQDGGLSEAEFEKLAGGKSYVEQLCQQLASYGIPDSVHHGDLHDGNIFFENGRHLFFDWGDSQITHPFFSLRTAFVSIENTFGYEEDDPRFNDIARDYLKPWTKLGSNESLWEAYQLAKRLWSIPSALQWKFTMSHLPELRQEMAMAVPSLLQEVLLANPDM